MVPVDTVFFAIRSALRLASALKTAYLEATIDRPLVLPLPYFSPITADSARTWFTLDPAGQKAAGGCGRAAQLAALAAPTPAEVKELLDIYNVYFHEASNTPALRDHPGRVSGDDLRHALTIRMWGNDPAAHPSALQRVGGTLVNIAVDYFVETPGAVSDKQPQGRALKAFLVALDDKDFAQAPLAALAGDLLTGVLDAVAATPDLLGRGPKESLLITGVARSMAGAATAFLATADTAELRNGSAWLGLAAGAFLRGGADVVLANPSLFLGDDPKTAAVADVGRVVADLVVGPDAPRFRNLLSGPGLETVSRAMLGAVAAHPALLKYGRLKPLLLRLAEDLSTTKDLLTPDVFPEIARLVVRRTGENLDLLWPAAEPEKHLLVKAASLLCAALSEPSAGPWKPRISGPQLVATAEAILDEVADNPDWLLDEAEPKLKSALSALLAVLRTVDGRRLSAEGGLALLRAGIAAATARAALLDKQGESLAVAAVLKTVVDALFNAPTPEARWTLARTSVAVAVGETVFRALARHGYAPAHLARIAKAIQRLAADPATFGAELVAARLDTLLAPKKKGKST